MTAIDRPSGAPRYAWYGDDFTGASDTLATLASAGLRALLFLRVPDASQRAAVGPLDAVGIAGIARALAPDAMRAELAPVASWFAALAPAITHYKCCSTFDSGSQVGNLAVGCAALRTPAHDPLLSVLGGQPSLGRYCIFGELYATAQADGDVHRIDRHPTMSRHPVTPMAEADLRRHLQSLGMPPVDLVDVRRLDAAAGGDNRLDIDVPGQPPPDALLFDSVRPHHLQTIGHWLWQRGQHRPLLVLGASSVAQAALAHWPERQSTPAQPSRVAASDAPVFLLVGSLSPVTAAQVRRAEGLFDEWTIEPARLLGSPSALDRLARCCADALASGRSVMAKTAAPQPEGPSPLDVAQVCAALLVRVLALAPQVRRVGVAGGDTSSIALRALDAWALGWAGTLANGVALTRVRSDRPELDGIELMLKGGQMGPPDLFERLLKGVE